MKTDLNNKLWNKSFKSEVYIKKKWKDYYIEIDNNNYYKYWKTHLDFLIYLNSLSLNYNDQLYNIPKCLYFDNKPKYKIYEDVYKNLYTKIDVCKKCIFYRWCKWINIFFLKLYWMNILKPVIHLSLDNIIDNKFLNYNPFIDYKTWNWNPPKINHYKKIFKFLYSFDKNLKIIEIGCFIWLFVDFLIKEWYKNIIWLDSNKDVIKIWFEHWKLPVYHFDAYKEDILLRYGKQDLYIMFWVFHNDYSISDYDISILDYCIWIIKNIYKSLNIGGYFIFTTHVFYLEKDILIDLWFDIIESFYEEESNWVYYYFLKKWR